ncbi:hypothetical protein CHU98_g1437 [Xylaria longipes]|nr:hypothetical protein CHU98_g1437 [Xylaria longipes]
MRHATATEAIPINSGNNSDDDAEHIPAKDKDTTFSKTKTADTINSPLRSGYRADRRFADILGELKRREDTILKQPRREEEGQRHHHVKTIRTIPIRAGRRPLYELQGIIIHNISKWLKRYLQHCSQCT